MAIGRLTGTDYLGVKNILFSNPGPHVCQAGLPLSCIPRRFFLLFILRQSR